MAGNWLGNPIREGYYNISGNFNPYTTAPNTAHVVWTTQQEFGGITGGDTDKAYYEGIAYEMRFRPPVIISGRLYLDLPLGHAQQGGGTVCLDLRTGKQIWWQNITIQMGQLYDYESPNQEGFHAYLWDLQAPTYKMYDAYSGELLTTFTNAVDASAYRRGAVMTGPHGELIIYHFDVAGGYMTMWNSSAAFPELYRGDTGTNAWQWRPQGKTVDWSRGVQMNVTVPIAESYGPWGLTLLGHSNNDDILTMEAATKHELVFFGFDAHTLQQLWTFNLTTAVSRLIGWNISPLRDGVFCVYLQEKKETYGYNAYTGQKLWGPTEPYENDWAMFYQSYAGGGPFSPAIAYGKLYATSYDGMVHCHDLKTGEELWTYSTGNSGLETPYGTWPFYGAPTIADDKLFVSTNEHSINNPIYRGERLHCINATTGEGIWNISAVMPGSIVADGYLVGLNYYDSLIYCFGKGQTATTMSASPDVSVYGDSVLIKGTVTDQSPGETCLGIPAAGTPAIADEYMTPWMEYLYEQKPMPQDVKGVEVVLETLDPNNNFYEIGRTTSGANGMYSFMFTPEVPGKYTIMATFKGSESYFSSSTETAIGVTEAPQSTPTPPPPAPSMADIYFMPMSIGLIIAIVAVGIVIVLMLRKR
jgi:outer membrane protein assembly factor BamB